MRRRLVVLVALVIALLAEAGADPAAAAGPSLTVTARSINAGDHVQLALTGVTSPVLGAFTCDTADLPGSERPSLALLQQQCPVTFILPVPPRWRG
jgi:hypothetical protein